MIPRVRVLVVDDSALMRKLIPQILERDPSIEVVGTAMDGSFGLKKIENLNPQVVTLDLEMPGMNGIDMLKQIMRKHPVPVIVVSSHSTEGASITMKALGLGAFDFVAKPTDVSTRMPEIATELIAKIKAAASSRSVSVKALEGGAPRQQGAGVIRKRTDKDHRHRSFDWWAERAAVRVFANPGRLSRHDPGGAAHAGKLHGNVRPASG